MHGPEELLHKLIERSIVGFITHQLRAHHDQVQAAATEWSSKAFPGCEFGDPGVLGLFDIVSAECCKDTGSTPPRHESNSE